MLNGPARSRPCQRFTCRLTAQPAGAGSPLRSGPLGGRETKGNFATGCDQTARTGVIKLEYGDTVKFLERHGYGRGKRNLYEALEAKKKAEHR